MIKMWNSPQNFLKRFLPPSARTFQGRMNEISQLHNPLNLFYLSCKANEVCEVHHDTFSSYKNIYSDREIVVVGTGPTLKFYDPIENTIHMGANGAYRFSKIKLEYLFVQDFEGEGPDGAFSLEDLKRLNCTKFVGRYIKRISNTKMHGAQFVADYIGAKTYFVSDYFPSRIEFDYPLDIRFYPLIDNASTIFAVIQFALYTHPRKIYLVGCDCSLSLGKHFDEEQITTLNTDLVYKNWKGMKRHIDVFYPDIEIVSINPIGLKGMFQDIYTDSYNANLI